MKKGGKQDHADSAFLYSSTAASLHTQISRVEGEQKIVNTNGGLFCYIGPLLSQCLIEKVMAENV